MKKGQNKRVWPPEQKAEIVYKHFNDHISATKNCKKLRSHQIVYMNRNCYPVSTMCRFFGVSRSGYYDYIKRVD